MGYTTEFTGKFKFNKTLDKETYTFLKKLSETRRMKRKVGPEYGVEGEFFVDGKGYAGQDHDNTIIDHNTPPKTQPGLWLQWEPTKDKKYLTWNGAEKFYNYVEWLKYLLDKILIPKGYGLEGCVEFQGEDEGDHGYIVIKDNVVEVMDRLPNNAEKFIESIIKPTKVAKKPKEPKLTEKKVQSKLEKIWKEVNSLRIDMNLSDDWVDSDIESSLAEIEEKIDELRK